MDHASVPMTPRAEAAMANMAGGRFSVTPENVLHIYAAVMGEVTRLRLSIRAFKHAFQGMPELGNGQPVSKPFSQSFDASTAKLLDLCVSDVDALEEVGNGFADAARAYGKTDAEIAASFDPSSIRYTPAPLSPASVPPALRAAANPISAGSRPSTVTGLFSGGPR